MNLIEASIKSMRQIALESCGGKCIDEHWEVVLSEMQGIVAAELCLTLHRRYIDGPMKRWAQEIARSLPRRDISDLDDATLVVHATARWMWIRSVCNSKFQAFVDNYARKLIHPPNPFGWVKSSCLWLPLAEETCKQMHLALFTHYEHLQFAQYCWNEVKHRHSADKEIEKHMFVLLSDSEGLRQQASEAMQWLRRESRRIAPDVGEDAMADCIETRLQRPLHIQIQKIGTTPKAIRDRAIDIRRKGGRHEFVSLEEREELTDTIPDESLKSPIKELMDNEFPQRFSANRHKIEEILSRESPKKRRAKIGKRRFKVMEMLTQTPTPTPAEIARQLQSSDQTIARDIAVIQQSWDLIQEVIHS